MALQKTYFYPPLELTISNTYWRIDPEDGINGGKSFLKVMILGYKNLAETEKESPIVIGSFDFSFVPDLDSQDNFIKQGYEYLKTLPEFKDAVNV